MGLLTTCPSGCGGGAAAGASRAGSADGIAWVVIGVATITVGAAAGGERVMRMRSSPSWISSSPIPEDSTSSINVFTLRRSIALFLHVTQRIRERQLVAVGAEPGDRADRLVGRTALNGVRQACIGIRKVHLDKRNRSAAKRGSQGS